MATRAFGWGKGVQEVLGWFLGCSDGDLGRRGCFEVLGCVSRAFGWRRGHSGGARAFRRWRGLSGGGEGARVVSGVLGWRFGASGVF